MTNYVKSTNFASKDALATGNPLKIVKGTEIDTEFNNIATAVATKAPITSPAFLGTPIAPTATSGDNSTQLANTAFVQQEITGHTVNTSQIENGAVTTAKLASGAATGAALGADVVQTTGAQAIAGVKTFSNDPVMGVSGLTGNIAAARITNALNASGSAPIYACRAWVNFNGTGTVAIRASGNVSSITDNGTGDYTINFTSAMPDANFTVAGIANFSSTSNNAAIAVMPLIYNTGSIQLNTCNNGGSLDCPFVNISIFR